MRVWGQFSLKIIIGVKKLPAAVMVNDCHEPLGVPGEEQINVVLFVNEN